MAAFKLQGSIPFQTEDIKACMKPREKLALVLPGGASLGRRQFGVIYWLYQIGVLGRVDMICGTSVGGLNALLIAKYKDRLEDALAIWNNITRNDQVYDGGLKLDLGNIMMILGKLITGQPLVSMLRPRGLYELMDREFGGRKLKDLGCDLFVNTTNISTGELIEISKRDNPDFDAAELAKVTSALPIVFPARDFRHKNNPDLVIDGGVGRNNPVYLAIKHGATKVLLVGTSPDTIPRQSVKNNVIDVGSRLVTVVMHILEEFAWDQIDDYGELSSCDPKKYPSIEFLDWYPDEADMLVADEVDPINFTAVATMQKGYDAAVKKFTKPVIKKFLLA